MSSQLPLPRTLRPNRSAHPGFVDMPRAKRSTEQVQAEQAAKESEKITEEESRKKTIESTAQVEVDTRRAHEEKRRHAHNPPSVAIARVFRSRPPGDVDTLGRICAQSRQEEGVVPNGHGEPEEGVDAGHELKEQDDDMTGAGHGDNGASGDDSEMHDELLDPSDDEQPKKRKRASKKGDLRELIQCSVDPLDGRKRKALMEDWHQEIQNRSSGITIATEFGRDISRLGSAAGSLAVVSTSSHSKPTRVVNPDGEIGGVSDSEDRGDTEDERSTIKAKRDVGTGGRTLKRTYAMILPTGTTVTSVPRLPTSQAVPPAQKPPRAREKAQLSNLPPHLIRNFENIFMPHLRAIFGRTAPWEGAANEDIKCAWAIAYPEEQTLDFSTPLGTVIWKLVASRLTGWRHSIGSAGIVALQTKVFPMLPASNYADSPGRVIEVRKEWCTWAISGTEEAHPLYFADVTEDANGTGTSLKGIFQSKIISTILGSHINSISPLCVDVKTDRPIGALVLSIQSAKRAIAFHTTGVMCKPLRPAADFSKANWGDHVKFNSHGYPTHVYPMSTLTALIKQLKPKQWEKILSAAIEESMVNLKTEESASTSTSVDTRPTPQLRDDDSDLE
ncbi:hypothetical protein EDB85DRAFT_2147634 [Lactarius pseudohatsudake]|nr:hypothetical protein EDB85DRAFT_2147634 [Lactarius pseudohatsudake]